MVVHKKLYANNQNDADKYNQGSKPQITVNGSSVLLNANTNGAGDHAVQPTWTSTSRAKPRWMWPAGEAT